MPGLQPVRHRYMLRNTKARSMARKRRPQNLQLPAELLHIIVSHVVGDYLDDLIVGPLSIPLADSATIRADMARFGLASIGVGMAPNVARTNEIEEKEDEFDFYSDKSLEEGNPIIALMQTAVLLRSAALDVLSGVLGIEYVKEGVGRLAEKPWHDIQVIRYSCSNAAYHSHLYQNLKWTPPIQRRSMFLWHYTLISYKRRFLEARREELRVPIPYRPPWNLPSTLRQLGSLAAGACYGLHIRPLEFGNEVVGGKGVLRIKLWAVGVAEFFLSDVCERFWKWQFFEILHLELYAEDQAKKFGKDGARNIERRAVMILHDSLLVSHQFFSQMKSLWYFCSKDTSREKVASARATLHMIMGRFKHKGSNNSPGQAAQKLCEWFDSVYGPEAPAPETTASSSS